MSGNTLLEKNPYLEISAGAGYTFERPSIRIAAEYTGGWAFSSEYNHLSMPPASLITVFARAGFFEERVVWSEIFIMETDDWSMVLNSVLSFLATDTLQVAVVCPLFFGNRDSAFGQYRRNIPVSLQFSWKF